MSIANIRACIEAGGSGGFTIAPGREAEAAWAAMSAVFNGKYTQKKLYKYLK
jgi:hypothetical protein